VSKSQRLRLSDVREVFHLLGECRELELDFPNWQRHMLQGLCRLTRAQLAVGGEMTWTGRDRMMVPIRCENYRAAPARWPEYDEWLKNPQIFINAAVSAFHGLRERQSTRVRQQLIDDREFYRSPFFNEMMKPGGFDQGILSRYLLGPGRRMHEVVLNRVVGDPPFGQRECRILQLFHEELGPGVERSLSLFRLAPRLCQTLEALLEGDSEKQVALRLGLSVHTVHEYVTTLYRRFDVSSRAELMAQFLRHTRARPQDTKDRR
jgi:DNA-binding CsgD family transcriptional regulator